MTADFAPITDKLFPLFFLVFVHDFEFGIDNVAFAPLSGAGAFFGATARLRFRSGLWTRAGAGLR